MDRVWVSIRKFVTLLYQLLLSVKSVYNMQITKKLIASIHFSGSKKGTSSPGNSSDAENDALLGRDATLAWQKRTSSSHLPSQIALPAGDEAYQDQFAKVTDVESSDPQGLSRARTRMEESLTKKLKEARAKRTEVLRDLFVLSFEHNLLSVEKRILEAKVPPKSFDFIPRRDFQGILSDRFIEEELMPIYNRVMEQKKGWLDRDSSSSFGRIGTHEFQTKAEEMRGSREKLLQQIADLTGQWDRLDEATQNRPRTTFGFNLNSQAAPDFNKAPHGLMRSIYRKGFEYALLQVKPFVLSAQMLSEPLSFPPAVTSGIGFQTEISPSALMSRLKPIYRATVAKQLQGGLLTDAQYRAANVQINMRQNVLESRMKQLKEEKLGSAETKISDLIEQLEGFREFAGQAAK